MAATGRPLAICMEEIRGRGTCPLGMETGGILRSDREVGAVCHWAALRSGGDLPWESEPGSAWICGPDPDHSVVFEIRSLEANG